MEYNKYQEAKRIGNAFMIVAFGDTVLVVFFLLISKAARNHHHLVPPAICYIMASVLAAIALPLFYFGVMYLRRCKW
jgi:Na+-driven multidrug efflux pump